MDKKNYTIRNTYNTYNIDYLSFMLEHENSNESLSDFQQEQLVNFFFQFGFNAFQITNNARSQVKIKTSLKTKNTHLNEIGFSKFSKYPGRTFLTISGRHSRTLCYIVMIPVDLTSKLPKITNNFIQT